MQSWKSQCSKFAPDLAAYASISSIADVAELITLSEATGVGVSGSASFSGADAESVELAYSYLGLRAALPGDEMKTKIQAVMHRSFLVIGLGLLAIGPILADIVNVTVNGSVSGSGSVTTYCLVPECMTPDSGQFTSFPFSFSATNTQLGLFAASGGASSTGPPETDPASVQADLFENTTATADALEITLSQDVNSGGVAFSADATLNESIAVSFNLTEESKIQLSDIFGGDGSPTNSVDLLDSKGNVILVVPCGMFSCSTVSTVLPPGTYQLDESFDNDGSVRGEGGEEDFSSDLNAGFTPVVPEPRWTIIATLLVALLGGYVMSRRETVKRREID
jgi:hypothetical protein